MSTVEFRISQGVLYVGSGVEDHVQVELASPVVEVVMCEDVLVVRFDPPKGSKCNENVIGVDGSGRLLWTIQARKYIYDDSPYVGITMEGNDVFAYNWDGSRALVDPHSGRILKVTSVR